MMHGTPVKNVENQLTPGFYDPLKTSSFPQGFYESIGGNGLNLSTLLAELKDAIKVCPITISSARLDKKEKEGIVYVFCEKNRQTGIDNFKLSIKGGKSFDLPDSVFDGHRYAKNALTLACLDASTHTLFSGSDGDEREAMRIILNYLGDKGQELGVEINPRRQKILAVLNNVRLRNSVDKIVDEATLGTYITELDQFQEYPELSVLEAYACLKGVNLNVWEKASNGEIFCSKRQSNGSAVEWDIYPTKSRALEWLQTIHIDSSAPRRKGQRIAQKPAPVEVKEPPPSEPVPIDLDDIAQQVVDDIAKSHTTEEDKNSNFFKNFLTKVEENNADNNLHTSVFTHFNTTLAKSLPLTATVQSILASNQRAMLSAKILDKAKEKFQPELDKRRENREKKLQSNEELDSLASRVLNLASSVDKSALQAVLNGFLGSVTTTAEEKVLFEKITSILGKNESLVQDLQNIAQANRYTFLLSLATSNILNARTPPASPPRDINRSSSSSTVRSSNSQSDSAKKWVRTAAQPLDKDIEAELLRLNINYDDRGVIKAIIDHVESNIDKSAAVKLLQVFANKATMGVDDARAMRGGAAQGKKDFATYLEEMGATDLLLKLNEKMKGERCISFENALDKTFLQSFQATIGGKHTTHSDNFLRKVSEREKRVNNLGSEQEENEQETSKKTSSLISSKTDDTVAQPLATNVPLAAVAPPPPPPPIHSSVKQDVYEPPAVPEEQNNAAWDDLLLNITVTIESTGEKLSDFNKRNTEFNDAAVEENIDVYGMYATSLNELLEQMQDAEKSDENFFLADETFEAIKTEAANTEKIINGQLSALAAAKLQREASDLAKAWDDLSLAVAATITSIERKVSEFNERNQPFDNALGEKIDVYGMYATSLNELLERVKGLKNEKNLSVATKKFEKIQAEIASAEEKINGQLSELSALAAAQSQREASALAEAWDELLLNITETIASTGQKLSEFNDRNEKFNNADVEESLDVYGAHASSLNDLLERVKGLKNEKNLSIATKKFEKIQAEIASAEEKINGQFSKLVADLSAAISENALRIRDKAKACKDELETYLNVARGLQEKYPSNPDESFKKLATWISKGEQLNEALDIALESKARRNIMAASRRGTLKPESLESLVTQYENLIEARQGIMKQAELAGEESDLREAAETEEAWNALSRTIGEAIERINQKAAKFNERNQPFDKALDEKIDLYGMYANSSLQELLDEINNSNLRDNLDIDEKNLDFGTLNDKAAQKEQEINGMFSTLEAAEKSKREQRIKALKASASEIQRELQEFVQDAKDAKSDSSTSQSLVAALQDLIVTGNALDADFNAAINSSEVVEDVKQFEQKIQDLIERYKTYKEKFQATAAAEDERAWNELSTAVSQTIADTQEKLNGFEAKNIPLGERFVQLDGLKNVMEKLNSFSNSIATIDLRRELDLDLKNTELRELKVEIISLVTQLNEQFVQREHEQSELRALKEGASENQTSLQEFIAKAEKVSRESSTESLFTALQDLIKTGKALDTDFSKAINSQNAVENFGQFKQDIESVIEQYNAFHQERDRLVAEEAQKAKELEQSKIRGLIGEATNAQEKLQELIKDAENLKNESNSSQNIVIALDRLIADGKALDADFSAAVNLHNPVENFDSFEQQIQRLMARADALHQEEERIAAEETEAREEQARKEQELAAAWDEFSADVSQTVSGAQKKLDEFKEKNELFGDRPVSLTNLEDRIKHLKSLLTAITNIGSRKLVSLEDTKNSFLGLKDNVPNLIDQISQQFLEREQVQSDIRALRETASETQKDLQKFVTDVEKMANQSSISSSLGVALENLIGAGRVLDNDFSVVINSTDTVNDEDAEEFEGHVQSLIERYEAYSETLDVVLAEEEAREEQELAAWDEFSADVSQTIAETQEKLGKFEEKNELLGESSVPLNDLENAIEELNKLSSSIDTIDSRRALDLNQKNTEFTELKDNITSLTERISQQFLEKEQQKSQTKSSEASSSSGVDSDSLVVPGTPVTNSAPEAPSTAASVSEATPKKQKHHQYPAPKSRPKEGHPAVASDRSWNEEDTPAITMYRNPLAKGKAAMVASVADDLAVEYVISPAAAGITPSQRSRFDFLRTSLNGTGADTSGKQIGDVSESVVAGAQSRSCDWLALERTVKSTLSLITEDKSNSASLENEIRQLNELVSEITIQAQKRTDDVEEMAAYTSIEKRFNSINNAIIGREDLSKPTSTASAVVASLVNRAASFAANVFSPGVTTKVSGSSLSTPAGAAESADIMTGATTGSNLAGDFDLETDEAAEHKAAKAASVADDPLLSFGDPKIYVDQTATEKADMIMVTSPMRQPKSNATKPPETKAQAQTAAKPVATTVQPPVVAVVTLSKEAADALDALKNMNLSGKALDNSFYALLDGIKTQTSHLVRKEGNERGIIDIVREASQLLNKTDSKDTLDVARKLDRSVALLLTFLRKREEIFVNSEKVLNKASSFIYSMPESVERTLYLKMLEEKTTQYDTLDRFWKDRYGKLENVKCTGTEAELRTQYEAVANSEKISNLFQKLKIQIELLVQHNATTTSNVNPFTSAVPKVMATQEWEKITRNQWNAMAPNVSVRQANAQLSDSSSDKSKLIQPNEVAANMRYLTAASGKSELVSAYAKVNKSRVEGVFRGDSSQIDVAKVHAETALNLVAEQLIMFRCNNNYQWPSYQNKIRVVVDNEDCYINTIGALLAFGVDAKAIQVDKTNLHLISSATSDFKPKTPIYDDKLLATTRTVKLDSGSKVNTTKAILLEKPESGIVREFIGNLLTGKKEGADKKKYKTQYDVEKIKDAIKLIEEGVDLDKRTKALMEAPRKIVSRVDRKMDDFLNTSAPKRNMFSPFTRTRT